MTEAGDGLREAARRAAERAEGARQAAAGEGEAPRPGDLYVLPATADFDVEWLVVTAGGADRWVVLPADLSQFPGGADVEVPAGEPGGPLTVYGRFPVTVPGRLLRAELRGGRVGEDRRAAAERRWREIAAGAGPPVRETDFDPDHRRRLVELAAAQQALAAAAGEAVGGEGRGPGEGSSEPARIVPLAVTPPVPARLDRPGPSRLRPPRWMSALAAVLAVAVIGLLGWNVSLQREVERLSGASGVTMAPEIVVDERLRNEVILPATEEVVVPLVWGRQAPGGRFRFSVLDREGRQVTVDDELTPNDRGRIEVRVTRRKLERGASLRLERRGAGGWETVLEAPYRLERD